MKCPEEGPVCMAFSLYISVLQRMRQHGGAGGGRMSPGGQFGGAVESGPWWPQRSRAQDGKAGWRQGMWAQQLPQRGREAVGPPL